MTSSAIDQNRVIPLSIPLGATLRQLRVEELGLTQREVASQLEISVVHLCRIEGGLAFPSRELVDRFREKWGVDLYVLAWCKHGDVKRLPAPVRRAARALADAMQDEMRDSVASCSDDRHG